MERLRKKLSSRRGASILIALLFLLLCMMVAASILMAAASNAGKFRSNREEQQKYLTLSSALRLVCDELEQAEYVGKYQSATWTEQIMLPDETGNYTIPGEQKKCCWYERSNAEIENTDLAMDPANVLNRLKTNLNALFANDMIQAGYKAEHLDIASLPVSPLDLAPLELKISVPDPSNPSGPPLLDEVTVKLTIEESYNIRLEAKLAVGTDAEGNKREYTMQAEMVATAKPKIASISSDREWRPSIPLSPPPNINIIELDAKKYPEDDPAYPKVTWKLNWIQKGAASE